MTAMVAAKNTAADSQYDRLLADGDPITIEGSRFGHPAAGHPQLAAVQPYS